MEMNTQQQYGYYMNEEERKRMLSGALSGAFGWMVAGLLLTAAVSWAVGNSYTLLTLIFGNIFVFYGFIIAELALVFIFSLRINKISAGTAGVIFILYALINGVTLGSIFVLYSLGSIATAFVATAGMFGAMAVYGGMTKRDISTWGNLLFMGLLGVIIATLLNLFMRNDALDTIICYVCIAVFLGLTAYDTRKIKDNVAMCQSVEAKNKIIIVGALNLYLDFINIFLKLLRLLNKNR